MPVTRRSFRLDVGPPDHLCPLCRVVRDELLEVGGRAAKHCASLLDKPSLDNGISDSGVNLPVELLNDLGGRAPRRANSIPCTRLIARYEIAQGWGRPAMPPSGPPWSLPRLVSCPCRCTQSMCLRRRKKPAHARPANR